MSSNQIEKQIELKASVNRVWQAITDHRQFGEWFRVALDGPFAVGETSRGHITWPGYEHLQWEAVVCAMEPVTYFAYSWHPYAIEQGVDYSAETPTLVEFRLKEVPAGTLLTVTESGFEKLPAHRRDTAFQMNEGGWTKQMENIAVYVAENR